MTTTIFFIIIRAHMNIVYIIKVNIILLIKCSEESLK